MNISIGTKNTTCSALNIPSNQIEPFLEFIEYLTHLTNNNIQAVWLNGSRSINRQKEDSDLDIVIIVSSEDYKMTLKDELKKHLYYKKFNDYFYDRVFEYWEFNNKEVGIHIYSTDEINTKVKVIFSSIKEFEKGQSFIQHNIINTIAISDPHKLLENLKMQSEYPEELRREQIEISLKRIKQEVEWWHMRKRWRSVYEEMHVIKLLVDEIAKCHYALNKRFYMIALKHYNIDQIGMMPNISKELMSLVNINPTLDLNDDKRATLDKILYKLMAEYMNMYSTKEITL